MGFKDEECIPCEGQTIPLFKHEAEERMKDLKGWNLSVDAKKISKTYSFKNFADAFAFASNIAALAEGQNHHPDLFIAWGKVAVELTTHAIGGLSRNDFILAAKIDDL